MLAVDNGRTVKSLLLVDDTRDYCTLVERAFRHVQPGTAVFPLSDGQRAIEHLALCGSRFPMPDLVLLDRIMPGGPDGYDVLRAARSLAHLDSLPILMVSGSDEPEHVERARETGADGYIVKPPVQGEYEQLARDVLAWRVSESWRTFVGTASGSELVAAAQPLQSAPVTIIEIQGAVAAPSPNESGLLQVFHSLRDLIVKTIDQVDHSISEACRKHCIPVSHARGRGQDQVTVANRHAVIMELMEKGYSDRVILENFQMSQRGVERVRAEWRGRKGGGGLTDHPL